MGPGAQAAWAHRPAILQALGGVLSSRIPARLVRLASQEKQVQDLR